MLTGRTLYHMPLSPFARAVRVALREKQISAELANVMPLHLQSGNIPSDQPRLVDENKLEICGSYAILEYLDEGYPTPPLIGRALAIRAEVRRLMQWFDTAFYQEIVYPIMFERVYLRMFSTAEPPNGEVIRNCKKQLGMYMDYIADMAQARCWLAGEQFSMADIVAASHISVLDYMGDIPWEQYHRTKEWYALIKSRPSFRPLLADRVRSFRPPSHYDNPDF